MAKITINNKEIEARDGQTILQVVEEHNIDTIPTMCHSEKLEPYTSCFLCVAEVEGAKGLSPTCGTVVRDGMKIETRNERVIDSRRNNLELLLSNHRADCHPPCRLGCPANMDIQGYIALAARGEYREGQKLMRETNALPMTCGRVCPAPCEDDCRRNYVDEPVDIRNIKRFMSDRDLYDEDIYIPETAEDTGKKVAIIGAGPAGLSAAHYLRIKGHAVTIFEKMPEAGGWLRYGIPEYRLPKKDLQKEIDIILNMGVEIHYNSECGRDTSLDELQKEYDAVFLGIGAQNGSRMNIPGEDLHGVMQAVDFLKDANMGKVTSLSGKVYVIGGGNSAIDAARMALRLGADDVALVYRRSEAEMPANDEEIHDAKEEGVRLMELTNPVSIEGDGKVTAVTLTRMELGEPDSSGRRRPHPVDGSEFTENVDYVIEAVGQRIDADYIKGIDVSSRGTIEAHNDFFTTTREGVFAGGDAVAGPWIVIGAVAHGRKAAHAIDLYLNGEELRPENRLGFHIRKEDFGEISREEFADKERIPREHVQKLSPEERRHTFKEVETGFTEEDLLKEAARCMECGCQDLHECKLREYSGEYGADKMKYIDSGTVRINSYDSKHRFIAIDSSKCINCGLCVRLCSEVQKLGVFGFQGRGFDSTPLPVMGLALDDTNCISCGLCVSECPVGAITEKLPLGKPGPFENRITESLCTLCGDSCSISVEARGNEFVKISSKIPVGDGSYRQLDPLCERGRFGYESLVAGKNSPLRGISEEELFALIESPGKAAVSLGAGMLLQEMDAVVEYAGKKEMPLTSVDLLPLKKKLQYIEGLELKGSVEFPESVESLFYFGDFSEEMNSVSFHSLIKRDQEISIHVARPFNDYYFRRSQHDSDGEMFKEMRRLADSTPEKVHIAFSLDLIDEEFMSQLVKVLRDYPVSYTILQGMPNINAMLERLGGVEALVFPDDVELLLSFYPVNADAWKGLRTIIFSDRNDTDGEIVVPLLSAYERTGSILSGKGEVRQVTRAIHGERYSLSRLLKGEI